MGCNTSQESLPQQPESKTENNEPAVEQSNPAETNLGNESKELVSIDLNKDKSSGKEEEEAAVRIQAAFRGHKVRSNMKQPTGANQSEPEPTQQELEAEFRADDVELCHAATRIQASFRGHMARKQVEKKDESEPSSGKADEEELDIDLSDPELNKAAVKIQASFRGHMVRKENENETDTH